MPQLMYAQMGLTAVNSIANVGVASEQSKLQTALQNYHNTISALQGAQARNIATREEIAVRGAGVREDLELQRQTIIAEGQARVSSAVAGVSGGSVDRVMQGIRNASARAQYGRERRIKQQFQTFGQERRNIALAQALNKDISVIPKPTAASTLVGISTDLLRVYDAHQPEGEQLFG